MEGTMTCQEKATAAAKRLVKKRGYVVIALPPHEEMIINPGDWLTTFAGQDLLGCELIVLQSSTREDWQQQAALLRLQDPSTGAPGERFFRCRLSSGVTL